LEWTGLFKDVIGLSRFEVGPLELALVLLLNAGEGVQAVKGAKEALGCGAGVLEGRSGVNGEGGVRGRESFVG
jgi:hypothetical protein